MQNYFQHLKHFSVALSFLTVFRLPWHTMTIVAPNELARSFAFYPVVGGILGTCCVLIAWGLSPLFPPLLLAALVTASLVVLTRALHLDGLADMLDGIGGGHTPERRLDIMKDSHIGSFGALALMLAVVLKSAAIHQIIANCSWAALFIAPAFSRFGMVLLAHGSPYARPSGGLAKPFLEAMTSRDLVTAGILLMLFSLSFSLKLSLIFIVATVSSVMTMKRIAARSLGGITGDVLGATNEITEVILFATAACLGGSQAGAAFNF